FLGFIELVEFAIDLGDAEIGVGIVGEHVGELFVGGEGFGIFFFGEQSLREAAEMGEFGGIEINGLAVGGFGFREVVNLGVGVAEVIVERGGRRSFDQAVEEVDGIFGFVLIEEELGELLDGGVVFRIVLEQAAKNVFGFIGFVVQAIEAREPDGGFLVGGIFDDGFGDVFALHVGAVDVAEVAEIDKREEAVRGEVVRVVLQNFVG